MTHLTLGGVSADGRRLLLVSDQGEEFTVDITPGLRAALRGQTTRLGQLEIQMTSSLRPRDIQERIRSGESPEEVAEAAGTTVEAIMPYAGPVLAEREHIAQRAQKSSIRRTPGEGAAVGVRGLGDAVARHLSSFGGKADQVDWDSQRRDDGRWTLTADYQFDGREGTASFVFDAPGNYVVPDNDDARWLIGELREQTPRPAPSDDLQEARQRRLASVAGDELPFETETLGADAIDLVNDEVPTEVQPVDPQPVTEESEADTVDEPASDEPTAVDPPQEPARRKPAKKRGRASVPSWEDIMFGGPSDGAR